jgi:solute carrier family 35 (GDP-fucose transporter), member C1
VVTLGFLLGVSPHTLTDIQWRSAPSTISIVYGILSSLFIAVHAVLIKSSLPHAHNSTIQLAYWQNLGSALFLAPFIFVQGEYGALLELMTRREFNGSVFVWGSIITGVFGFLLCVAGLLSIKVTSPITHMFSSVSFTHL